MVVNALDAPVKETWQYVLFRNETTGAVVAAYTDRDSDTVFEGQLYLSETRMEVQLPENDGLLTDSPCNFVLPLTAGFTRDITSSSPYPRTVVDVVEFIRADGYASVALRTFSGLLVGFRRNHAGRKDYIALSALSVKSRLQGISIGEPCNHQCINRLGDGRCQVSMLGTPRRVTVTVDAIDGQQVTLGTSIATGLEDRFYQRGYMVKDGLEISIQIWRNEVEGDKQAFFMTRRPPTSWVGTQVTLFSGCDKTAGTCDTRYGNLEHFNGRGYHMPAYHPNFEDGGSRQ